MGILYRIPYEATIRAYSILCKRHLNPEDSYTHPDANDPTQQWFTEWADAMSAYTSESEKLAGWLFMQIEGKEAFSNRVLIKAIRKMSGEPGAYVVRNETIFNPGE